MDQRNVWQVLTFSLAIVCKLWYFYCFCINYLNVFTVHIMGATHKPWDLLGCGWFKLFWYVDISKSVLTGEVINSKPLDFCDFLVVRQCESKVFVKIAVQYICPVRQKIFVLCNVSSASGGQHCGIEVLTALLMKIQVFWNYAMSTCK